MNTAFDVLYVIPFLLGAGFVLAGVSLFQTLLPLRAGLEAFSTTLVGFLGSGLQHGFGWWDWAHGVPLFAPPFIIDNGHIDEIVSKLDKTLKSILRSL